MSYEFCNHITAMISVMSVTVIDVSSRDLLAGQTKGSFVLISFLDVNLITEKQCL